MIGCLRTRVRKQPIIALYFESETVLQFYNLKAMLWSFEKGTILTPLSKNLALQNHMSITGLRRRLSSIGIDAIWQLSLGCLLMRTISSFLRYIGYLNFINDPISCVFIANLSLHTITELSILLTSCLTAIINHVIKYCTTVYE